MLTATLLGVLCSVAAAASDTVVVCPQQFRAALQPWVEHRTAAGHRLTFLSNLQSPESLRTQIRHVAQGGNLKYVVLVGDAEPEAARDPNVRARCIAVHYAEAKVNVRWGSEPHIATDNWYADLDDDRVPDVAIGRLTADSPAELTRMVDKILRYEREPDFTAWRRRINFVAGLGGFGVLADSALEMAAKKLITDGIPAGYATSMTYASWRSPYCPDPRSFREATIDRLNEGCLFWVYIGHGQQRFVDWMRVPGANYPILSDRDVPQLKSAGGAPIACFLACYTAAFDQPRDCLAEEMLRTPGAPVAIVGGSRVTMPYAMAVMGVEFLDECFKERQPTLGAALLAAKRHMMHPVRKNDNRASLDTLAALISPAPVDLNAERAEHLELFNLIGDPLLALHHPQPFAVSVSPTVTAGDELQIEGDSPIGGNCAIELVVRRDRLAFAAPLRLAYDPTPKTLEAYSEVYARANDHCLSARSGTATPGRMLTKVRVPETARGLCHVRVYVEGKQDFALGAADVEILPKPEQPTPPGQPLQARKPAESVGE